MSEQTLTPNVIRDVADLRRRVYELQRRRIPQGAPVGSGSGDDPLLFLTTTADGSGDDGNRAVIRFGTADPLLYGAQFLSAYDEVGNGSTVPYFTNYWEQRADPDGVQVNMRNANGSQLFYSTDLGGGDFLSGVTANGDGGSGHLASFEFDGRTDSGAVLIVAATRTSFVSDGNTQTVALRYDDTFEWSIDAVAAGGNVWYFGSTGGLANTKFGVFDRGATPAVQHAAINMSGETVAVQAIYDAMAAYGWFAP